MNGRKDEFYKNNIPKSSVNYASGKKSGLFSEWYEAGEWKNKLIKGEDGKTYTYNFNKTDNAYTTKATMGSSANKVYCQPNKAMKPTVPVIAAALSINTVCNVIINRLSPLEIPLFHNNAANPANPHTLPGTSDHRCVRAS